MRETPLRDYTTAAGAFVDLVGRVPEAAWGRPALGEWDVRSLVGHTARALSTVRDYLGRPAETIRADSAVAYHVAAAAATDDAAVAARGREAGAALGGDPAAAVRASAALTLERLRAVPPGTDPVIESVAGGIRLSDYLPTRTLELVVHGLDIARATGVEGPAVPPELLGRVGGLLSGIAAAKGHGPEVLAALSGRAPLPRGFSALG